MGNGYVPIQINKEINLLLSHGYEHVNSLAKTIYLLSQPICRNNFSV